jgi:hypothetical protein
MARRVLAAVLLGVFAVLVWRGLPDARRYLKIARM